MNGLFPLQWTSTMQHPYWSSLNDFLDQKTQIIAKYNIKFLKYSDSKALGS